MPKYTFIHGQQTSDENVRLIKRHTARASRRKGRLGDSTAAQARTVPFESHVATLNFKELVCSCTGRDSSSSNCLRHSELSDGVRELPGRNSSGPSNVHTLPGMLVWEQRAQTKARKTMSKMKRQSSTTSGNWILPLPPPVTLPPALRIPELILKCSSDFISSTILPPTLNSPSAAVTLASLHSTWSPLPTTYLLLFKLAFDILETGNKFMVTAFQLFDALLAYTPYLLRLQTPSALFAYMFLMASLLAPANELGGAPDAHAQLRVLLRRQLVLTARVVLGRHHPVTIVSEALADRYVDSQLTASRPQLEERTEGSNVCLRQVVDRTRDIWGRHSAQHMITACHYEGGLRGQGLQVAWEQPTGDMKENYPPMAETGQRVGTVPIPAMDEVAVVSPANGGTSVTFSLAIPLVHAQIPALGTLVPIAMRLFAAVDAMQRADPEMPTIGDTPPGREVADTTRALLHCLATDDAVKVHFGWRLRADGNYSLAIQPGAKT